MSSPALKPRIRTRTIGARVTNSEHQAATAAAANLGMTLSEWARHLVVRAISTSDTPAPVGPQHVLLLLQELLALRDIVVDLIAAKPLPPGEYQRILNEIDAQKTMGAQGMLAGLSANRSLPFPKG